MRVSTLFRTAVMTDSSRAPATLSLSRLLLLDAVWRLRSLSDAAKECGLSVSTASRQLSQARKDFGDELFIRSGYELYPTDRMNALSNELEPLLARLSGLMRPEEFDPATLRKTFRVMTADNGFMAFIAPSLRLLQEQAPRVSLDIVLPQPESIERMLKDGSIDLAITPIPQNAADLESLPLARIRKCLLMRKGHPLAKELLEHGLESLTPEKIAKWPQAFTNLVKVPEEKSIVNPPSVLRISTPSLSHCSTRTISTGFPSQPRITGRTSRGSSVSRSLKTSPLLSRLGLSGPPAVRITRSTSGSEASSSAARVSFTRRRTRRQKTPDSSSQGQTANGRFGHLPIKNRPSQGERLAGTEPLCYFTPFLWLKACSTRKGIA